MSISWIIANNKELNIYINFNENNKNFIKKFKGIQYSYPYEDIGQIFHELVLIPSLFFFPDDISIIHGSAVQTINDKTLLIGGTGGVGKTSLELSMIHYNNFKFLSDDISIIDKDFNIWPNYAFPKIYRYNTVNKKEIEKKLLKNRKILDKFQWNFFKLFPNKPIRRRVDPRIFYDNKIGDKSELSNYFILFKGNYNDFNIKEISPEKAANISIEIIKTEYSVFFKHIFWHKINRMLLEDKIIIDEKIILKKWFDLQKKVFNKCTCNLVEIPLNYNIIDLEKKMLKHISSTL